MINILADMVRVAIRNDDQLLAAAVRNNAEWCDAVFRARDHGGEFSEHLWVNLNPAPPYYPNIITLQPATPDLIDELRSAIETVRARVGGAIGVKDSFADIDLYGLGLNVLFDAEWHAQPAAAQGEPGNTDLEWRLIEKAAEHQAWQIAWDADTTAASPVFAPALLADPNLSFIAGYDRGEIVAGAIANSHAGVVGLSNLFTRNAHIRDDWRHAIATAVAHYPGLPVVGYGPAAARPLAESLGYSTLGPLRIWTG